MYDTNMGKMGDDGVYERIWIEDECGYQDDLRPASPHEVDLYLKHCDISYFGDKEEPTDKTVFAVVRGDCSYVLYDSDAVEEYRRESTKFNLP